MSTFFLSLYMKIEKWEDYDADMAEIMEKVASFFWDPLFL